MHSQLIHHSVQYESDSVDFEFFEGLGQSLPVGSDNWAAKRKRDYLAGRFCASECLSKIKQKDFQVQSNDDRSPIWPSGYCGSITHTHSYACCVISPISIFQSIGIDSEHKIKELTFKRVKRQIASDKELNLFNSLFDDDALALTIIFSSKEAIFKAIYPIVKKHFYFDSFEVIVVHESFILGRLVTDLDKNFTKGRTFKISYRIIGDRIDALVTIKN